ncbi:DALR anticodon-binding domain-containing protein 3 isoform X1 [Neodiprion virginianus]|uniref:DALR anticodon-binding domain-containing protein 3 isoform X1 n=1 Tax=Neodiprion virginianus TaxID=2961670 RepID=UPI001EE6AABB|nr:DALR anticodon-binding domain-containing protein 3 isoform X1 [Neodiprion virginianus]
MEGSSDFRIKELVNSICRLLLGVETKFNEDPSILKINNENLSEYGDVCFLTNLVTWKKVFRNSLKSTTSCRNILEHYLIKNEIKFEDCNAAEKAFQNIIKASRNWSLKIEKCQLGNERVSVFLNRTQTFADVLPRIVVRDHSYGQLESKSGSFFFHIIKDLDSDLTNLRLRLIKGVAENIVKANGYQVSESSDSDKYYATTKSKRDLTKYPKILLCGVAKNSVTGTKETALTEAEYLNRWLAELADTTEHKLPDLAEPKHEQNSVLLQIAEAVIVLQFLAVKPSRTITISSDLGLDESTINVKGSSFIFYNTARISAIFQKFDEQHLKGDYPSLPSIEEVDFSLLTEAEEWELMYIFLLGYPEMVKTCARLTGDLEICPHYICSFLSRLVSKFSAYYRRVRILTEGRDHLLPTMMARLYLLKAIQIVTRNALRLLNLDPVSRM